MTTALQKLQAHSNEFRKEVMQVLPGVWTAIGYAASNVSMIITEHGLIIIDTTESTGAAENILAEFRKITDLPIKTILLTHGHRDHISGAEVFSEGGASRKSLPVRISLPTYVLLGIGRSRTPY